MLGYQSQVVNGQLVNVAPAAGFDPIIFGAAYTGPAYWPRQGVYNVPPVLPSGSLQASMAPSAYGATGTPTLPSSVSGSGSPLHPTKSPLWFGLGFLIIGILMLQYIHYK
jgi:hypothetical protein